MHFRIHSLLLFVMCLSFLHQTIATHKCVWVTGVLRCNRNEKNHMNVEVRVYDKDGFSIFQAIDPDDQMGVTFTDSDGKFHLDGCGDDFNWLPGVPNLPDPYVTIKHYCNSPKGETIKFPEFDTFAPNSHDLGIIVLDDQHSLPSTTETTTKLPTDREPNRSIHPKFKPHDETMISEMGEILTHPDHNPDDKELE
ncbi:hypothetical protein M3Y96_00500100 [Aphelenchoides besseyi]|nr:hypothetical protein M3Y96_00500100 [Aphelenchoides besseyi]